MYIKKSQNTDENYIDEANENFLASLTGEDTEDSCVYWVSTNL